ncbi:MAG TPA: gamma-glutamylcyclotransferase [Cyclobacteriaceae bacterium]|jgi:gamma-glutamylcyclotransferase (GGCT)/AIG2-like uncharacterized protein YtfP
MNKNGRYAFYGTLRHGIEYHSIYTKGMDFLQSVLLRGYRLYSLGDYPYAVRSDSGCIVADLYKVNDPEISLSIHLMELEAGYYYDEIIIDSLSFGIYLFESPSPGDEEIRSGDWVRYVAENGF